MIGHKPGNCALHPYIIPLSVLFFLSVLAILTIVNLRVTSKDYLADLIVRDIRKLKTILELVNQDCKILSFDYQKNRINFLNVKSFVGSEVGSINLVYADKWRGPYLDDNPTFQDKEYLVVRTKKGFFITPGEGVILPNGKVIGTDIVLSEDADIAAMMNDDQQLRFNKKPLAGSLNIKINNISHYQDIPFERI